MNWYSEHFGSGSCMVFALIPIFPPQVNRNDDKCNQYKDQSKKYPLITYASFWKNRKIKQYEKNEYIHGINV